MATVRPRERAREFARAPRQPVRGTRARRREPAGVGSQGARAGTSHDVEIRREDSMTDLDSMVERWSRRLARAGRRSVLRSAGRVAGRCRRLPLLPGQPRRRKMLGQGAGPGDSATCDYWRYCAIDGFLCACCGGSVTVCPPGTEPAPITWVGTCRNAADGRTTSFRTTIVAARRSCGRCLCNRNEGDGPLYRPPISNDYNWCVGSKANIPYHCTVSRSSARPPPVEDARPCSPLLLLAGSALADAMRARQNYLIHCMGCHGEKGPGSRR